MRKIIFLLFFFLPVFSFSQLEIQGIVIDSVTLEPLPFVNIAIKGTSQGATTGLNGKFTIAAKEIPCSLVFSYVGYQKKELLVSKSGFQKIKLAPSTINLAEAIIYSGPDPALELMKKVVANADKNNPEKNGPFSYTSYNKMVFTIGTDSIKWSEQGAKITDEEEKEMVRFFEKQHLFMSECVSERQFLSPGKNKETVIASKVSGFATPAFNLVSTQFQSFHFYTNEVSLSDVKYVGPVCNYGLQQYRFSLRDTFYIDTDTIYAVYFHPKNENSTTLMKGVLQIHSDGYAIFNVIAEPFKPLETGFGIRISQQYQKIEKKQWFPVELNTRLILYGAKIGETPVVGIGTGILKDIRLNPPLSKKDFDEFELVMAENLQDSEKKLQQYRQDSLSNKELETYRVIDSLGEKHKFDRKILAMQSLVSGMVPIKFLDWDLTKLLNFNDYEGLRLGLGLRTNHRISKYVSLGGYIAYGFGDKAFKSGADLNCIFSKKRQFELNLSVKNDVEAASVINFCTASRYLFTQGYSALFLNRFDSLLKYEGKISFRALQHFKFSFIASHQERKTYKDYSYATPLSDQFTYWDDEFILSEIGGEIRMLIREKFIETPFGYISTGSKWPSVSVKYVKGLKGIYGSEYEYNRFTLKSEHSISSMRIGTFHFIWQAGVVNGESPYHLLFNPAGTYKPINKMTVFSMDGFETMRLNELLFDRFYSIHFRYQLPKPIINGQKFRPRLSITSALTQGKLTSLDRHQNLDFSVNQKPFTESGLVLDNLLKSGVSGFGIGAFYRWGAYQFQEFKENIAIKISLSLSLG